MKDQAQAPGVLARMRMFAKAMAYNIMRKRFKQGTPATRHKRVHDRADGPNSRTSFHMLRRSVNKGFRCFLEEHPHIHPRSDRDPGHN